MERLVASRTIRSAIALGCAIGVLALAGCTTTPDAAVTVTATYRERMLLGPGAVLQASIVDVSIADASATTLASVELQDPGSPPYRVEIPFDPGQIDSQSVYAVRATIRSGDELMFATDTVYPVLTRGAGREAEILLVAQSEAGSLGSLPATFTGRLPCASCPGIDYHLDLFGDSVFYLRRAYVGEGEDATVDDLGAWQLDRSGGRLAIWGRDEAPTQLRMVDVDTLRLLDRDGREISSALNYALRRTESFEPTELSLELQGMFRYMADAGLFEECHSGRVFAVAQEADNAALERQYLAARREPGEPLMAAVEGRIAMRRPMEGQGLRPTLTVTAARGVWPGETCGARMSRSDLLGTNWVLTRLGDRAVAAGANQQQARLVLSSTEPLVSGYSGCNDFTGAVEITGPSIRFGELAVTMRACADGMESESELLAALGSAASFSLLRHHLELADRSGALLARFEARELR